MRVFSKFIELIRIAIIFVSFVYTIFAFNLIQVRAFGSGLVLGSSLTGGIANFDGGASWSLPELEMDQVNNNNVPNQELSTVNRGDGNKLPVTVSQVVPSIQYPAITIPQIGLEEVELNFGSVYNLDDLYSKMRRGPVVESQIGQSLCAESGNTYITGHSEPSSLNEIPYKGSYVFSRLAQTNIGSEIILRDTLGNTCKYRVYDWDKITTDSNDQVDLAEFNRAYFPKHPKPTLTIQTCQKGSATVRLLLRAEKI